jgi:hypothetical protein
MSFIKARFSHPVNGATAGLVFAKPDFDALSIEDLSRRWPMREATKMALLELSPVFEKAVDAFSFDFRPWVACKVCKREEHESCTCPECPTCGLQGCPSCYVAYEGEPGACAILEMPK